MANLSLQDWRATLSPPESSRRGAGLGWDRADAAKSIGFYLNEHIDPLAGQLAVGVGGLVDHQRQAVADPLTTGGGNGGNAVDRRAADSDLT